MLKSVVKLCFLGTLLHCFYQETSGHTIRVSSDIGFSGTSQEINLGNSCFNLAHPINDDISSVDPNGKCIRLYTNERCRGTFTETEEVISDLTSIDINDAISSIRLCHTMQMSMRTNLLDDDDPSPQSLNYDYQDVVNNFRVKI